MLRLLFAIVVLLCVLALTWMSFLRVNNLEDDVRVLQAEVARLKGSPTPPMPAGEDVPVAAPAPASAPAAPPVLGAPPAVATPAATPEVFEAHTSGFLDEDVPDQFLPLPAGGAPVRAAEVTILAIQGDGAAEVVLPDPIRLQLQPGAPQSVNGICQGPETAAWVFTLEPGRLRVSSRECDYPVRGLRPRLRIRLAR